MVIANLAFRFALELFGVAALAFWGFHSEGAVVPPVVVGIAAPLVLVVVWSRVVAPKARNPLAQSQRNLIGTALLLGTAIALGAAGAPALALAFAVAVVANQVLLILFGDDIPGSLGSASRGN